VSTKIICLQSHAALALILCSKNSRAIYLTLYISTTSIFSFILTFSPECQTKSFEKMNTLLSAIFKFCTIKIPFNYRIYQHIVYFPSSKISSNCGQFHKRHIARVFAEQYCVKPYRRLFSNPRKLSQYNYYFFFYRFILLLVLFKIIM